MKRFLRGCSHCGGTGYVYDETKLGPHLRDKRLAAAISLKDMAAALAISPQYLNDLEKGHRHWTEERAARYVLVLARKRPQSSEISYLCEHKQCCSEGLRESDGHHYCEEHRV